MQNTTSVRQLRRTLLAATVAALFPLHGALAQDAKPASEQAEKTEKGQLETVTVTAQRRVENIREVPISISTLKGEKLDVINSAGLDIRMLAARIPSLNIESSFGRTFPRFYVRGLGNTDFDLNASQPVSLVVDDIVQESPILKGFPVFDIDQVEVLRGPQGTLFGRNSPAGVIKFDSTRPTRNVEGYFNASFATHKSLNMEGAVNVPIADAWAMRVSAMTQQRDDYVRNTVDGPTKEFEGYTDSAARVQFLYQPSAAFSGLLNVHGRDMKGTSRLFRANIIQRGTNDLVPGFNRKEVSFDGQSVQDMDSLGANLRLKWTLDGMTLHAITGYETVDVFSRGDIDGGYGAVFAPPSGPGVIPFSAESADGLPEHRQLSQEVRLESNNKGPFNWLAGLYYFDEEITVDSFSFDSLAGGAQNGYARQHQRNKAWAAYGTVNYAPTDRLKLRGGLRYTSDRKDFVAERFKSPLAFFGAADHIGPLRANPKDTNVSWDLSANYALDRDTNVYARVANGFRAPSIQGRILFGDEVTVANSETVQSYEAGWKQDLFNRRARLGVSVFHYTLKDMQLTAVGGGANFNRLINADRAVGKGLEVDFQANLSDAIQMTLGASYNDTEIRDPNLKVAVCGSGCTVRNRRDAAGLAFINGNPLPMSPKWVGNFTLRYQVPMGDGDFFVYTDWAWRSKINFFLYDSVEYTGKSMVEGGLRVGYKWDKYEVALFGRNITDQTRIVGGIDFNNLTGMINEPRIWGVQFKSSF